MEDQEYEVINLEDLKKKLSDDLKLVEAPSIVEKKMNKIVNLLSSCIMIPDGNGAATVRFMIDNENYREQLQDFLMAQTKKFLESE